MLCLIITTGYHGNKGWPGVSLNDTVKLADPENPLFGANSLYVTTYLQRCQSEKGSDHNGV